MCLINKRAQSIICVKVCLKVSDVHIKTLMHRNTVDNDNNYGDNVEIKYMN